MDIYCFRISIAECPCVDIPAWISMWISTLVWIIEDWHPKIMDIHSDIRGFLEIHVWISYGFSDQGLDISHWTSRLVEMYCRSCLLTRDSSDLRPGSCLLRQLRGWRHERKTDLLESRAAPPKTVKHKLATPKSSLHDCNVEKPRN